MGNVIDQRIDKDEHLSGELAIAKVRKLLPSFRAAMFVTGVSSGRELHSRPLALQGDPAVFGGTLFFFADDRSPKVYELAVGTAVSLFFQNDSDSAYLQLDGTASLTKEKSKMRELFTPMAKTWFPEGLDDPHLTLIRVDVKTGAYWEGHGALELMASFATALVTGKPAKGGHSGTLNFA